MIFYHGSNKFNYKNVKFNYQVGDPLDRYLDGYTLLFEDDFDTFDTSIWNCETRTFPPNSELQAYIPANVSVENSNLVLTAKRESYNGRSYTSGKVSTNNNLEILYGRIDAKVKMPNVACLWPAFWTLGSSFEVAYEKEIGQQWPSCGEIDILEKFGLQNISNATHFNNDPDAVSSQASTNYIHTEALDYDKYHVISLEWSETTMKFLVDNTLMRTYDFTTVNAIPFTKPHFLMFNLAVGGRVSAPTDDWNEGKYYIDWIRIYELPNKSNSNLTGISINNKPISVNLDDDYLLETTNTGVNSYIQTINWESNNPSVAEVYGGRVIPIKTGSVTMTARHKTFSDSCTFTITNTGFTSSLSSEEGYVLYAINERNVESFNETDLCCRVNIGVPDENGILDKTVSPTTVNYKTVDSTEYNKNKIYNCLFWNGSSLAMTISKYSLNKFSSIVKADLMNYVRDNELLVKIKLADGYKKLKLTSDMSVEIKQINDYYINFAITIPVVLTDQRVYGDYFSTPQSTNDLMRRGTIYGYLSSDNSTSIIRVTASISEIPNQTVEECKSYINGRTIFYK